MLDPQLDKELAGRAATARISDRVKWILKRLLAGNRPDILTVARELGVSARTLRESICTGAWRESRQQQQKNEQSQKRRARGNGSGLRPRTAQGPFRSPDFAAKGFTRHPQTSL